MSQLLYPEGIDQATKPGVFAIWSGPRDAPNIAGFVTSWDQKFSITQVISVFVQDKQLASTCLAAAKKETSSQYAGHSIRHYGQHRTSSQAPQEYEEDQDLLRTAESGLRTGRAFGSLRQLDPVLYSNHFETTVAARTGLRRHFSLGELLLSVARTTMRNLTNPLSPACKVYHTRSIPLTRHHFCTICLVLRIP